jgi:tetratricopeptide (TPR) repeat protein
MSPEQPSSKIGKSVGEKLRAARIAQHYTQSQLAAPDFSVSYISAIERGQIHPSLRALEILATRLGLTSTQLLPNRSQQDERLNVSGNHIERDEDEVELALLENHILLMQGEATEAIEQLENISTKRLQRQHQLQHRYLLGWAYYQANQFQESEYILSEAAQIAKEINAHYLHLRILNQLAMAYAAMRNFGQAILAHQRALELAESTDPYDPFFTIQVYMQMGQHYTRLGNLEPALEMFRNALDITAKLASEQSIQAVYADLSHYYATKKDDNLAILYAYKSAQLHNQESIKRLRSELHHYLGHAIMQGDQEQARTYLDEVIQNVSIQQDPLAMASIATRNAEWYFTKNTLAEAEKAAKHAEELAEPFGNTIIRAEALIMQGRIEYAEEHHEEGSQHFVAGLDMLEQLASHQELADESVRYAQLLEGIGREREAFTHFRRAFQSKQKLGK